MGVRDRVAKLQNPLLAMKLEEFVIADDDAPYVKHYFRCRYSDGYNEEFVVIYERVDSRLHYLRTHRKRIGQDPSFRTLSERGPWSSTISQLIDLGTQLSATHSPTKGHFVSSVSAHDLLAPNWVPPASPAPQPTEPLDSVKPPAAPSSLTITDRVRKDPKHHAVWLVEPEPGDYVVVVVQLDDEGKLVEAWSIKTFPTRKEQGAFGLEVARHLRIKLMDVVDTSQD
jgi:hypothetical protein